MRLRSKARRLEPHAQTHCSRRLKKAMYGSTKSFEASLAPPQHRPRPVLKGNRKAASDPEMYSRYDKRKLSHMRRSLSDFRNSKPIALVTDRERVHSEIAYVNAVRSRPDVKGTVRSRTPVASKIAFASAAGTGEPAASPAPYAGWSG